MYHFDDFKEIVGINIRRFFANLLNNNLIWNDWISTENGVLLQISIKDENCSYFQISVSTEFIDLIANISRFQMLSNACGSGLQINKLNHKTIKKNFIIYKNNIEVIILDLLEKASKQFDYEEFVKKAYQSYLEENTNLDANMFKLRKRHMELMEDKLELLEDGLE